jgi:alpha-beta hydrolase superfamily lysophospholipase
MLVWPIAKMRKEIPKTFSIDFTRFKASDGVELQGWLSRDTNKIAVIHIHGMSGNGYENYFLDNLREIYAKNGISFFSIDTRGRGIISSFWKDNETDLWGEGTKLGGSCFEIFSESIDDIQGAIDYLKTQGRSKFVLQGHSLGGSKVVNFLVTKNNPEIIGAVLLAPTDMVGWANTDPRHPDYLKKSEELISRGEGEELVSAQCWLDKTPLSAQTYPSLCKAGTAVDIYGERAGGALLGKIRIPVLIAYGDSDIGILKIDGNMDKWIAAVNKIKNQNTRISVIKNATHSFRGCETELAKNVESFLKEIL